MGKFYTRTAVATQFKSAESSWWDILRPAVVSASRICSGVSRLWTYLELLGLSPSQALTLLGEVRFITWSLSHPFLGECRRDPRHFWSCRARLGLGSAPGPDLKKGLVPHSYSWWDDWQIPLLQHNIISVICQTAENMQHIVLNWWERASSCSKHLRTNNQSWRSKWRHCLLKTFNCISSCGNNIFAGV